MTKRGDSFEGEFFNDMKNGHGNNIHSYIHSLQGSTSGQITTPTTGTGKIIKGMGEVSSSGRVARPTTGIIKMIRGMEKVSSSGRMARPTTGIIKMIIDMEEVSLHSK